MASKNNIEPDKLDREALGLSKGAPNSKLITVCNPVNLKSPVTVHYKFFGLYIECGLMAC